MAAAVWWVLDGTETRRTAVLDDNELVVGGDMGKYSYPTRYMLAEIDGAAIVMPEESKWPVPALFFIHRGEEQAIGIDRRAGLKRLAQSIHDVGVPVRLDGWEPGEENEFEKVFRWQAPGENEPTARIAVLPDSEPGLYNPAGIAWAIFLQCWALGLWAASTAAIGYYAFIHWNNLGIGQIAATFVVPLAGFIAAAQFTDRYATAATSDTLIRGAKDQIAKREHRLIDPRSEQLIPVEVFEREQFSKGIQRVHEMGFVQIDHQQQRVLFEGKKEQRTLPADSVGALAVEEVQTGTPGQSALGGLNYYVTLTFSTSEGDREYGLRFSKRDYGDVTDVKRAAGAVQVFEAIESVLPTGAPVASTEPEDTRDPGDASVA